MRKMQQETREQGYTVIPESLAAGFWGIDVQMIRTSEHPVAVIVLIARIVRMSTTRLAAIASPLQGVS